MDLSRLQSGQASIEKKAVHVQELISEVVRNFQQGHGTDIMIEEILPASLPALECDPDMITQVLNNLLTNAIRYAVKRIVVKAEVFKGTDPVSQFVKTTVANDGPSISSDKLDKLFGKFVQLDRANRTGQYKGTGLGLAICKEIIEKNGGMIWVESPGEGGVAFHFTLPILLEK